MNEASSTVDSNSAARAKLADQEPTLRRALNLPLLVFYGVGVTVGAGIFALIGEVVRVAGDHAMWAFLLAGLIAGAAGLSYALLSGVYPRAAGEAVYVSHGLGSWAARFVGYGICATAIFSSSVIALSFGGYLGTLLPVPIAVSTVVLITLLAGVAWLGVRESVAFAAVITLLEVGTLMLIIFFGAPTLSSSSVLQTALLPPMNVAAISVVFSAAILAFFAFIGFEDIVNMAEETINPGKVVPRAILLTLAITISIYAVVAIIAVGLPDRAALTRSAAPMATIFESVTGWSGKPVSVMAAIAMINGILVQIVMASRVMYGMTRAGLAPPALGKLNSRRTPGRAIVLVALLIVALALGFPLVGLAQVSSLIILTVFSLVNVSLWQIGSRPDAAPILRRWRYWGVVGALLTVGLLGTELFNLITEAGATRPAGH